MKIPLYTHLIILSTIFVMHIGVFDVQAQELPTTSQHSPPYSFGTPLSIILHTTGIALIASSAYFDLGVEPVQLGGLAIMCGPGISVLNTLSYERHLKKCDLLKPWQRPSIIYGVGGLAFCLSAISGIIGSFAVVGTDGESKSGRTLLIASGVNLFVGEFLLIDAIIQSEKLRHNKAKNSLNTMSCEPHIIINSKGETCLGISFSF